MGPTNTTPLVFEVPTGVDINLGLTMDITQNTFDADAVFAAMPVSLQTASGAAGPTLATINQVGPVVPKPGMITSIPLGAMISADVKGGAEAFAIILKDILQKKPITTMIGPLDTDGGGNLMSNQYVSWQNIMYQLELDFLINMQGNPLVTAGFATGNEFSVSAQTCATVEPVSTAYATESDKSNGEQQVCVWDERLSWFGLGDKRFCKT